jgi:cytochrome c biogenesis protein CcmG/thiol:disulfide interchange protein DsbE
VTGSPERAERRSPVRQALTVVSLALVAALFAALVIRLVESSGGAGLVSAIRAGKKPVAPQFNLAVIWPRAETWPTQLRPNVSRGTMTLRDLRGFPTVLNFWASWCTACGTEASRLAQAARLNRGKVVFVGLDVNDFGSDAHRFLERHHVDYVSLSARGSSVYDAYGLIGLPETYYLDRNGRVVAQTVGELTPQKLAAGIARAEGG